MLCEVKKLAGRRAEEEAGKREVWSWPWIPAGCRYSGMPTSINI